MVCTNKYTYISIYVEIVWVQSLTTNKKKGQSMYGFDN